MSMSRRAPTWALFLTMAAMLSLAAVTPVAAKEGMEARLDAPLSIGSVPGSTMHVGWTVFIMSEGKEVPVYGSPVFIRLLPRAEGEPTIAFGTERPNGSGHYLADIVVPPSGIGIVEIGMRGEQCEAGMCSTSDMVFHVTGDPLAAAGTPGAVVGVLPAVASPAAPVAAAPGGVGAVASAKAATDAIAAIGPAANASIPSGAMIGGVALLAALVLGGAWAIRRRRQPSEVVSSQS
jgi:MYXO-CTERM domain-containing protein